MIFIYGVASCIPSLAYSDSTTIDKPTLLILGDSLSAGYGIKMEEGWVALLEKKMMAAGYDYRIVNASISGETTAGGLSRLPKLLDQYKPDLLLIEQGANDGLRGFPIQIMKDNLSTMLKLARQYNAQALLIGIQLPLNYGKRYSAAFEDAFVTVSQTHNIPLAPSLLGKVPLDNTLMQEDNLHPNASAQPHLLNNVWPHLQPLLQSRIIIQ